MLNNTAEKVRYKSLQNERRNHRKMLILRSLFYPFLFLNLFFWFSIKLYNIKSYCHKNHDTRTFIYYYIYTWYTNTLSSSRLLLLMLTLHAMCVEQKKKQKTQTNILDVLYSYNKLILYLYLLILHLYFAAQSVFIAVDFISFHFTSRKWNKRDEEGKWHDHGLLYFQNIISVYYMNVMHDVSYWKQGGSV